MREEIFEGIYIGIHWLWRETWRHTGTGTEPPIFLETTPPPPGYIHNSIFAQLRHNRKANHIHVKLMRITVKQQIEVCVIKWWRVKLFPTITSIPSDYLLISQVTNHVCNRGFCTCLSCFYRIDREHHALKSLELKFDLSLEFSEFCIGNTMISSDIWHKYHEWYFKNCST